MIISVVVVGMMEMGNKAPRVGIGHASLVFQTSVLTIILPRLPDVITIPTPTCPCSSLPETSVETTTLVPLEL